ncbi:MAG: hypothetical protein QGH41_07590, partial [Roseibacillus sp.]|nr:hypothetical protein [Roseibacillus sp.]
AIGLLPDREQAWFPALVHWVDVGSPSLEPNVLQKTSAGNPGPCLRTSQIYVTSLAEAPAVAYNPLS